MSAHWDNVWTFRTAQFNVTLDCTEETDPDLSWDESGETALKVATGEWHNLTFRVQVSCKGMGLGADYLGNSIYANPEEFRDHIGMKAKGSGSYFSDMVRGAIQEARSNMSQMPRLRTVA